ncbi:YitT family protein ['Crotalaria aegyptiaca' phytoplasma]|uniref:YitT family protein n=1 Tax=Candidatus Phytoplasma crotalariae TaxID=2982627 RepID=A0ABT9D2R5_9MOLU|nr:YitT family protein ['Crotalaria aegyptiaca' phytoplasma]MDO8059318.1 YitT family protein ['Crotalaria aegyptiaca' phytoplasma]
MKKNSKFIQIIISLIFILIMLFLSFFYKLMLNDIFFLYLFLILKIILGLLLLIFSIYFFILAEDFIVGGLESNLLFLDKVFLYNRLNKKQNYLFSNPLGIIISRLIIMFFFGFWLPNTFFFLITTVFFNLIFTWSIKFLSKNSVDKSFFINLLPIFIKKNKLLKLLVISLIISFCIGIGCGLIFSSGSSTGGTDIIFLLLNQKFNLNLHYILFFVDGIIILISFLIDLFRYPNMRNFIITKYFFSFFILILVVNLISLFTG